MSLDAVIPGWLAEPRPDPRAILLATRVRLARNVPDASFRGALSPQEAKALIARLRPLAEDAIGGVERVLDEESPEVQDAVDLMRVPASLISEEDPGPWSLLEFGKLGATLLDGDHFRLWSVVAGLDAVAALSNVASCEVRLAQATALAKDSLWGWRTASPTDAGTGMRASCLMLLPALVLSRRLAPTVEGMSVLGMGLRGPWGVFDEEDGPLLVLSNLRSMGVSEAEICLLLEKRARRLAEEEERALDSMAQAWGGELRDAVARTASILSASTLMSRRELSWRASLATIGARLGWLEPWALDAALQLCLLCRSARLQRRAGALAAEFHPSLDEWRARAAAEVWQSHRTRGA